MNCKKILIRTYYTIWDGLRPKPSHATVPLKGQCHEIFCFWFFYESVSPQPQSIPLGPFQIFSKIRGDIRKSRCTTGVNDTGGKFATGVNDTGGKLPPVSRHGQQICHRYQRHRRQILRPVPLVLLTPAANNENNIRLQTP
jgi:hypothetical protein